jgi:glycosyltransferase involved in cell wall biosynthesis
MSPQDHEDFLRLLKNLKLNSKSAIPKISKEINAISIKQGIQPAYNHLLRAEVALNLRKPSVAIYDHAFHFIGGAQKYGLTIASALQEQFDVTLIANHKVSHKDFLSWYHLDLSKCRIKVIKLPYFEERQALHLDPALIPQEAKNPFHLISRESGHYDIFVNNSMNEMVYPLSSISVLICHFPERRPKTYFYADQYTYVISNSHYTAEWIKNKWKISPHDHIYPPVDMEAAGGEFPKKKTILSVARFEPEGTKRQREMIEAFLTLNRKWPELVRDWKFILVGGSNPNNPYLARLEKIISDNPGQNVELKINIPIEELKRLYRESTLFWHLCGLKHEDPSAIEHFGMTTVEAMQNKMVPIVYNGGGLREIVDHGVNGFRVDSKAELLKYSMKLFRDPKLIQRLSESAYKKAQAYARARFEERVKAFFDNLLKTYGSPQATEPLR